YIATRSEMERRWRRVWLWGEASGEPVVSLGVDVVVRRQM
ncbi:hypothetical protein A2U01_0095521, partial [Trifolium medium]|nr:hypothetical protein [Trifolium medium]